MADTNSPSPLKTNFHEHKSCDWAIQGGVKTRQIRGEDYPVLLFVDRTCTFTETVPVNESGEYVVFADRLVKEMGWHPGMFLFAGAWFFRHKKVKDAPAHFYIPTLFLVNEFGVCNFSRENGER